MSAAGERSEPRPEGGGVARAREADPQSIARRVPSKEADG